MTFHIDFNPKDRTAAPTRTVRVRRLDDGHFEFLEPVQIVQREFEVIVNEPPPTATRARSAAVKLSPAWSMGSTGVITRADLYDDLI